MRIDTRDWFWVVTDPGPHSVMADVLCHCTLENLRAQFLGGLTCEENPTIFTDRGQAIAEAEQRLAERDGAGTSIPLALYVCSICRRVHGSEIIHACE